MAELATNKYLNLTGLGKFWTRAKEFIAKNYVAQTAYDEKMKALDAKDAELDAKDEALVAEDERLAGLISGVDTRVTTAEGKITALEAKDEALVAEDERLAGLISGLDTRMGTAEGDIDTVEGKVSTIEEKIEVLEGALGTTPDGEGLIDLVSKNTASIKALVGDDVKEDGAPKSVRAIANEELASQLLSGKADADFKTLQDLAAWLEDHPESVAAMNGEISGLKGRMDTAEGKITAVEGRMDTAEGKITALEAKDEALVAEDTRLAGLISGVDTRVTTAEGEIDALQETVNGISDAVNSLDATYVTHEEFNSAHAVISDAEIEALFAEE